MEPRNCPAICKYEKLMVVSLELPIFANLYGKIRIQNYKI